MKTDQLFLKHTFMMCLLLHFTYFVSFGSSSNDYLQPPALPDYPTSEQIDSLYLLSFKSYRKDVEIARANSYEIIKKSKLIKYKKGESNGNNLLGVISKGIEGDYEKALFFYNKALALRIQTGVNEDIASVYNNIGKCLEQQGKLDEAIHHLKLGLQQMGSDSLNNICSSLYFSLSNVYSGKKQYSDALIYLDKTLNISNKTKNKHAQARYHKIKGFLYYKTNNYEGAKIHYFKALELYDSLKSTLHFFDVYNGLGNVFSDEKKHKEALLYYKKASLYRSFMNAYINSALDNNIGSEYKALKQYDLAIQHLTSSIEARKSIKADQITAFSLRNLADVYVDLEDYDKAIKILLEALTYIDKSESSILEHNIYSDLSAIYEAVNNHEKALLYSKKYIEKQDSFASNIIEASNLQTNLEIKEKENAELQNQILAQSQTQLWNRGLAILSVLFGLFMGAGFIAYRNRQKRLVAEFEADQAYLQIDDILRQQELNLAYAKLQTKDEMQKQIGQDLHDRLGVMLSTIKLYFGEFVDELRELNIKSSQHQDKTIELLDEAVVEVRRIAHNMQSGVLKNFGLLNAVQDLAETITQTGKLEVTVSNFGMKDRLPDDMEGKLFKVIQELVGNVLKHANATKLGISLYKKEDLLNIIVEDNGVGFNVAAVSDKGGMGLKNITFRISELGGKCHFDSNEKVGTSVIIDIPIENTTV